MPKTSLFELYLAKAQTLANELNKLQSQCQEMMESVSSNTDTEALYKKSSNNFFSELAKQNPLGQGPEQQEYLAKEYKQKAEDLYFQALTKRRDLLFQRFCELCKELTDFSSVAQAKVIELMQLKDKAHNRNVFLRSGKLTQNISSLTDVNVFRLFEEINKSYLALKELADVIQMAISASLLFKPTAKALPELAIMTYKTRGAMARETEDYHSIENLVNNAQGKKIFASFNQYIETNPDGQYLLQALVEQLKPVFTEIQNNYTQALQIVSHALEAIECARKEDSLEFMRQFMR